MDIDLNGEKVLWLASTKGFEITLGQTALVWQAESALVKVIFYYVYRKHSFMVKNKSVMFRAFLTLYHTIPTFNDFETTVGKGENAGNQHFSFSHNIFHPFQREFLFLSCIYFVVCKCFQSGPVKKFVVW